MFGRKLVRESQWYGLFEALATAEQEREKEGVRLAECREELERCRAELAKAGTGRPADGSPLRCGACAHAAPSKSSPERRVCKSSQSPCRDRLVEACDYCAHAAERHG